jgi:hypothetical protein
MTLAPVGQDAEPGHSGDGPDKTLLRLIFYLWLAVVGAWMVAACQVLQMVPR